VNRSPVPAIRFHDLRHTHATLLIAAGVAVKVVSERVGHSHPGFTMKTYQHVMPGGSGDDGGAQWVRGLRQRWVHGFLCSAESVGVWCMASTKRARWWAVQAE
jgi:hypothetical protein